MNCLRCNALNPEGKKYCGDCGAILDSSFAPLKEVIERIIPDQIQLALKQELKNQKSIETEITENVVNRLLGWARVLGFFFAVPIAVLVGVVGKSYFDVRTLLGTAQTDVKQTVDKAKRDLGGLAEDAKEKVAPSIEGARQQAQQVKNEFEGMKAQVDDLIKEGQQVRARYKKLQSDAAKYEAVNKTLETLTAKNEEQSKKLKTLEEKIIERADILVNVFDGTRKLVSPNTRLSLVVIDGNGKEVPAGVVKSPSVRLRVPFHDSVGDNYSVTVSADGFSTVGYTPVHVSYTFLPTVDLMLLRKKSVFNFQGAAWERLKQTDPGLWTLLTAGTSETVAKKRYEELMRTKPGSLAGLLNLSTAMRDVDLPSGRLLSYLKELVWDNTLAEDRFFAYADQALGGQLKVAAQQGDFAPAGLQPSATSRYKQIGRPEARLELVLYENDKRVVGGVNYIKVECSITKDPAAHTLIESDLSKGLLDAKAIYVLLWTAGRRGGVPEFNPPYTIE